MLRVYVLRVNVPAGRSSSSVVASILASETNWLHKFLMSPAQSVAGFTRSGVSGLLKGYWLVCNDVGTQP